MIRSEDWNEAMNEIERLNKSKLSVDGGYLEGSLSIGDVTKKTPPLVFGEENKGTIISKGDNESLFIGETGLIGIGTKDPQSALHVEGDLLGVAKDIEENSLRIRCGKTPAGKTEWVNHSQTALILDVDISWCGFRDPPFLVINLHGTSNQFMTTGGCSAYDITTESFRVWLRNDNSTTISSSKANTWKWHIQWIAVGN